MELNFLAQHFAALTYVLMFVFAFSCLSVALALAKAVENSENRKAKEDIEFLLAQLETIEWAQDKDKIEKVRKRNGMKSRLV